MVGTTSFSYESHYFWIYRTTSSRNCAVDLFCLVLAKQRWLQYGPHLSSFFMELNFRSFVGLCLIPMAFGYPPVGVLWLTFKVQHWYAADMRLNQACRTHQFSLCRQNVKYQLKNFGIVVYKFSGLKIHYLTTFYCCIQWERKWCTIYTQVRSSRLWFSHFILFLNFQLERKYLCKIKFVFFLFALRHKWMRLG